MYVLPVLCVLYLLCSAPTSSQDWPLDCTPRKTVPYHSVDGKLFRENDVWNYTTMALREDLGLIILGTRGAIFALDINNINNKKASVKWDVTEKQQEECTYKGKDSEIDCQNYIRILHGTDDGRMYVCGTNAFHPMCDYMNYTDGQLLLQNSQEDGKGKCPFDPFQRYASAWVEKELYSATSMNFLGSEPVVLRSSEDQIRTDFKSSWLNEPNFIYMDHIPEGENSPDGDDDKVYLFFSETAVEYDFYHKLAVSRVARVCKGDMGGQRTLQRKWTSFVKARLECPVLESQLPYLVQDVFRVCPAGLTTCVFYAVFTPQMDSSDYSAVCAYSMRDIQHVFTEGKFKTPVTVETSFVKWVMFSGDLPTPRPGACIDNAAREQGITSSLELPDKTLQFIRDRPLMDQEIGPINNRPLLVKKGAAFTRIVVASVVALDRATYHVMFIGTETGSVLKAVNYAEDNTGETFIIEELQLFQSSEAIKILRLSNSKGHLFAGSEVGVVQMPLSSCGRYKSCGDCVLARDPYCAWDLTAAQCATIPSPAPADSKLIQNLQNGDTSGCPPPETAKLVNRTFVPGNNVKLECEPISNLARQEWFVGEAALVLSDKHHFHNDSLMILNASAADAAVYSCWSVERSHGRKYRRQKAKYQLALRTNGDGRWVLPTSPQARSSHQRLVGLQILVVLLSVTLALLVGWNFYKGHLTLPCKLGRGQTHTDGSPGEAPGAQQPLQHTEEKTSAPAGNSNNNHANQENAIPMDGHAPEEESVI
ncbi:semaphorin-4E [Sardina pilchardus]|uniref:semaphorin-4E n=1 Tax=Sardina pilchardus TaxID=27697 RepID=UPI002E0F48EB